MIGPPCCRLCVNGIAGRFNRTGSAILCMSINWTRDECILALNAYMGIRGEWNRIKVTDPVVIATSEEITRLCNPRTPGSIKSKFSNFMSLDPMYEPGQGRGTGDPGKSKGLENGGYTTERVWKEFSADQERLSKVARAIHESLEFEKGLGEEGPKEGYFDLSGFEAEFYEVQRSFVEGAVTDEGERGYDVSTIATRRRGQEVFRARVLTNFGERCCITGEGNAVLLRAGHIKPWNVCDEWEKVDPGNGLCLEPRFDLAFDKGLISVDEDMRVELSTRLVEVAEERTFDKVFRPYAGRRIREPKEYEVDQTYLAYHRDNVFQGDIWNRYDV